MVIRTLSEKRGIRMLYDGSKYIIWSDYYGVVAESTKIERKGGLAEPEKEVEIWFDICEWYGYWDLQSIISRGITKYETSIIPKTVIQHYQR